MEILAPFFGSTVAIGRGQLVSDYSKPKQIVSGKKWKRPLADLTQNTKAALLLLRTFLLFLG